MRIVIGLVLFFAGVPLLVALSHTGTRNRRGDRFDEPTWDEGFVTGMMVVAVTLAAWSIAQ
jgi:hypothetical protein